MSAVLAGLIDELQNFRLSTYFTCAGLTILWYDWFLTIGDEIELIWTGRMTTVKGIYLFNRYTVPIILSVDAFNYVGPGFSSLTNNLSKPLHCMAIWTVISFASIHWLVAMRVWSIWGRSTTLLVFLISLFVACELTTLSIAVAASVKIMDSVEPIPIANICFVQLPRFFSYVWVPNMVLEAVVFVMMCIKATHHTKSHMITPVLSALYRDGVLYFFIICISGFFNLLVWAIAPATLDGMAKFFTFGLVNVAAFRLVLDLRDVGTQAQSQPTPFSPNNTTDSHRARRFGTTSVFSLLARPTPTASYQTPSYPYPMRLGNESRELKPRAGEGSSHRMKSPEGGRMSAPEELEMRVRSVAGDPRDMEANEGDPPYLYPNRKSGLTSYEGEIPF